NAMQRVVIVRQGLPVGMVSRRTLLRWLFNDSWNKHAAQNRGDAEQGRGQRGGLERSIGELAAAVSRLTKVRAINSEEQISSSVVAEATRIQETVEGL